MEMREITLYVYCVIISHYFNNCNYFTEVTLPLTLYEKKK